MTQRPTEMFAAYLADRSAVLRYSVISRETAPSMVVGLQGRVAAGVRAGRCAWMNGRQFHRGQCRCLHRGKAIVTTHAATFLCSLTAIRVEGRRRPRPRRCPIGRGRGSRSSCRARTRNEIKAPREGMLKELSTHPIPSDKLPRRFMRLQCRPARKPSS